MANWKFRFDNTPYENTAEESGTVDFTLPHDDMPLYPFQPRYDKNQSVFYTDAGGARVYSRHIIRRVTLRWDSAEEEVMLAMRNLFLEHLPFDFYEDLDDVRNVHFMDVPSTKCIIVSNSFAPRELVDMSYALSVTITESEGERLPL